MGKFDGILLCTDMDGTLLRNDKSISAENLQAIEYFKREGGFFTFVTGRVSFLTENFCKTVSPNAPFGCVNGAGLYDHVRREFLWRQPLPPAAKILSAAVERQVPEAGILIYSDTDAWFCKDTPEGAALRKRNHIPERFCTIAEVPEPVVKTSFVCGSPEVMARVEAVLRALPLAEEMTLVCSEQTLFEILPKGIGKGKAIEKLREFYGERIRLTVAVGDYYNDIPMLEAADLAVAVANAVPEAKAAADYVTVSNEEHAIAQVIADLEKGKRA